MAWTDRLKADDIVTVTVGATALVARVRNASRRASAARIDVGAIKDTLKIEKGGRVSIEIPIEMATETAQFARSSVGSDVTFTHDIAGSSESGTALLAESTEEIGGMDGAQTESFTLVVQATN